MASRQVLIFEDPYSLTNHLLTQWTALAEAAIRERGIFTAALSGGKTPMEFYCRLANLDRHDLWSKTHIFLTDERFVPALDPASNFRLLKNNLFDDHLLPDDHIHPIIAPNGSATFDASPAAAEETAAQYAGHLETFFGCPAGEWPRFDFMLLGVGEDGHTASLFPNDKNWEERSRSVTVCQAAFAPQIRISLTLPVINNAACIIFLIQGKPKAVISRALLTGALDAPAAQVLPQNNNELFFLLDKDAAQQLRLPQNVRRMGEAVLWSASE
ncbi:MAG: 6-phosphogluconolactonase [Candidatus Omnitrophica bacterium]|nr:6-phosphogluconolactonase [Candidatus Omnitrophota bacterium]